MDSSPYTGVGGGLGILPLFDDEKKKNSFFVEGGADYIFGYKTTPKTEADINNDNIGKIGISVTGGVHF